MEFKTDTSQDCCKWQIKVECKRTLYIIIDSSLWVLKAFLCQYFCENLDSVFSTPFSVLMLPLFPFNAAHLDRRMGIHCCHWGHTPKAKIYYRENSHCKEKLGLPPWFHYNETKNHDPGHSSTLKTSMAWCSRSLRWKNVSTLIHLMTEERKMGKWILTCKVKANHQF